MSDNVKKQRKISKFGIQDAVFEQGIPLALSNGAKDCNPNDAIEALKGPRLLAV